MKKNIYSRISLCAVLLFLGTAFFSNAQNDITNVVTTPGEPIPRNSSFTVSVSIGDGAPTNGIKTFTITVSCGECTPTSHTTTTFTVASGSNSGTWVSPPFTSPNREGSFSIVASANKTAPPTGPCNPCKDVTLSTQLPVTLVKFDATLGFENINLTWQTSAELNNDRFIIETSTEGEVFNGIGEIAGAGTTAETHTYQFIHQTPSAGANYYRLKQVDFDGTFAYSKVIAINAAGNNKIFAFPNPAKDQLNIQYDQSKGPAAFFLFDAMGRQVIASVGGYAGYYEAKLPSDLPAGTYWLRVIRSGMVQTLPIVKQ